MKIEDLIAAYLAGLGYPVVDALIAFGWADSKNKARRLISQGAVKIGKTKVYDQNAKIIEMVLVQKAEDGTFDIW